MSRVTVHRFGDEAALYAVAADHWAVLAREAVEARGLFQVALAGGSSPRHLYRLLAGRDDIPWDRVEFWFGDERCVPLDHPDSNFRMVRETLFSHRTIPAHRLHPMMDETLSPEAAARAYERQLEERLPAGSREVPCFDLVMLGLGPDGHIASLFPESAALGERHRWVVENYVAKFDAWRITLTYPTLEAARRILFIVTGEAKAEPVGCALLGDGEESLPVQRLQPLGKVEWFLDAAAASRLPEEVVA